MSEELLPEQRRAMDYLLRKGSRAPVETLRTQLRDAFAAVEQTFDAVAVHDRERSPAPGKWSPHQILDHLVLSHEPAIAQLESLLAGADPDSEAIPAGLQSATSDRAEWDVLRNRLAEVHRQFLRLLDVASDESSLQPTAPIVMVVKVGGEPKQWIERLDWKAFVQAIRVHTLEHQEQVRRV